MASQGPRYAGTIATAASAPENANDWLTPSHAGADDAAYAEITAATYDANDISFQLRCQNLGFTIPSGATIDGLVVEIERYCDVGSAVDYRVQFTSVGGPNYIGDNKADTVNAWPGTPTIKSYGGATDLWNYASWTVALVNSVDFGIYLSVKATVNNTDIHVDYIRVTIYYTAGGTTYFQTLTATAIGTGALSRITTYPRTLPAVAIGAPTLVRVNTFLRTLAVTAIGVPTLVRGLFVTLAATAVGATTLAKVKFFTVVLGATAISVAVISRVITYVQAVPATATGVAVLSRIVTYGQTLAATAAGIPTLVRVATHFITLSATASGQVTIVKGMFKTLAVTAIVQAGVITSYTASRTLSAVATGVAGLGKVLTLGGGVVHWASTRMMRLLG